MSRKKKNLGYNPPPPPVGEKVITVRISAALHAAATAAATKDERTLSQVVRMMLQRYVDARKSGRPF